MPQISHRCPVKWRVLVKKHYGLTNWQRVHQNVSFPWELPGSIPIPRHGRSRSLRGSTNTRQKPGGVEHLPQIYQLVKESHPLPGFQISAFLSVTVRSSMLDSHILVIPLLLTQTHFWCQCASSHGMFNNESNKTTLFIKHFHLTPDMNKNKQTILNFIIQIIRF